MNIDLDRKSNHQLRIIHLCSFSYQGRPLARRTELASEREKFIFLMTSL
jgi:hypothetical protein